MIIVSLDYDFSHWIFEAILLQLFFFGSGLGIVYHPSRNLVALFLIDDIQGHILSHQYFGNP